tara:strand:- start:652 stop:759 length:108 start_codon:yes stop_codon:yes gene_type:complete
MYFWYIFWAYVVSFSVIGILILFSVLKQKKEVKKK